MLRSHKECRHKEQSLLREHKDHFTVNTSGDDLVISLSKEQTKSLKAGRYVYDIIIDNGTKRIKVLEGQLHVEDSVTFDSP